TRARAGREVLGRGGPRRGRGDVGLGGLRLAGHAAPARREGRQADRLSARATASTRPSVVEGAATARTAKPAACAAASVVGPIPTAEGGATPSGRASAPPCTADGDANTAASTPPLRHSASARSRPSGAIVR